MFDNITPKGSIDRSVIRSATKLVMALLSLLFLWYLLTLVPGIDRVIPATPLNIAAIIGVVVTLVIVGILFYLAPVLQRLTAQLLTGPGPIVANIASIVFWLVLLVAVLIAHSGFAGVANVLLAGHMWMYDVVFLVIALVPIMAIAIRLYDSLDPTAEFVTSKFA